MDKAIRITLGVLLLAVGVAGVLLPIVPGWPFLGLGVMVLATDVPFFRRLLDRAEHRFPRLHRTLDGGRRFLERFGLAHHAVSPAGPDTPDTARTAPSCGA